MFWGSQRRFKRFRLYHGSCIASYGLRGSQRLSGTLIGILHCSALPGNTFRKRFYFFYTVFLFLFLLCWFRQGTLTNFSYVRFCSTWNRTLTAFHSGIPIFHFGMFGIGSEAWTFRHRHLTAACHLCRWGKPPPKEATDAPIKGDESPTRTERGDSHKRAWITLYKGSESPLRDREGSPIKKGSNRPSRLKEADAVTMPQDSTGCRQKPMPTTMTTSHQPPHWWFFIVW